MRTKEPRLLLEASTFQELHDRLPGLEVDVPPPPAKRGDPAELYSIVRLLGTVPLSPSDFPLQLTKFDRPDFSLQLASLSIGIEHVEARSRNATQEAIIRATLGGSGMYLVQPAAIGDEHKSRKELLKEINAGRMPPPMMGDSVERNWADAITFYILDKVDSVRKEGYRGHDQYWLAVYDSWPALALEREHALALLRERLSTTDVFAVFERVYLLSKGNLIELSRDRVQLFRLHDYGRPVPSRPAPVPLAISPGGRCSVLLSRGRRE